MNIILIILIIAFIIVIYKLIVIEIHNVYKTLYPILVISISYILALLTVYFTYTSYANILIKQSIIDANSIEITDQFYIFNANKSTIVLNKSNTELIATNDTISSYYELIPYVTGLVVKPYFKEIRNYKLKLAINAKNTPAK